MAKRHSVGGPGLEALLARKPARESTTGSLDPAPPGAAAPAAAVTVQLNVRIPEDLRDAIDVAARAVGLKQAPFVVQALRAYLEGHGLDAKHRALAEQLRDAGR